MQDPASSAMELVAAACISKRKESTVCVEFFRIQKRGEPSVTHFHITDSLMWLSTWIGFKNIRNSYSTGCPAKIGQAKNTDLDETDDRNDCQYVVKFV